MNVFSRSRALGAATVLALTVAGCGADHSATDGSMSMPMSSMPMSSMPMSMPASSATSTTGTSPMSPSSDPSPSSAGGGIGTEHNAADVMFAQMMIVHHQGAIDMAQLAPDRATSQEVKDLAAQVEAAQAPEIQLMTGWLQAWGARMSMGSMTPETSGGMGGMATGTGMGMDMSMPGMTADQMAALTAASGAGFDKMFLEMMIAHHQGAVQMADTEIAQGSNPDALALADTIKTSQTAEITTMQQLLQGM